MKYYALRLKAPNDPNGNSRHLLVLFNKDGGFRHALKKSVEGWYAAQSYAGYSPADIRETVHLAEIPIDMKTYREFLGQKGTPANIPYSHRH